MSNFIIDKFYNKVYLPYSKKFVDPATKPDRLSAGMHTFAVTTLGTIASGLATVAVPIASIIYGIKAAAYELPKSIFNRVFRPEKITQKIQDHEKAKDEKHPGIDRRQLNPFQHLIAKIEQKTLDMPTALAVPVLALTHLGAAAASIGFGIAGSTPVGQITIFAAGMVATSVGSGMTVREYRRESKAHKEYLSALDDEGDLKELHESMRQAFSEQADLLGWSQERTNFALAQIDYKLGPQFTRKEMMDIYQAAYEDLRQIEEQQSRVRLEEIRNGIGHEEIEPHVDHTSLAPNPNGAQIDLTDGPATQAQVATATQTVTEPKVLGD